MIFWPKDAFSVGYLETFEAMPRRFKLLDLSQFLAAPLMTLAAYLSWAGGGESWSKDLWVCFALFLWLMDLFAVSNFVRGIRARLRGVAAQPENPSDLGSKKRSLIVTGLVTGLLAVPVLFPYAGHPHYGAAAPLGMLSVFFHQLSTYARARYWNRLSNGTAIPAASA